MDIEQIKSKILVCIENIFAKNKLSYSGEDDLTAVGMNSLMTINLILEVEQEFDLSIPDIKMDLVNFSTRSKLEALVEEMLVPA